MAEEAREAAEAAAEEAREAAAAAEEEAREVAEEATIACEEAGKAPLPHTAHPRTHFPKVTWP